MSAQINSREAHFHHSYYESPIKISESGALYLTNTIRMFALSLIGIFLPLYILNLSYSYVLFSSDLLKNGLIWILLYYFVMSAFICFSIVFLSGFIFEVLNFRKSIMFSLINLSLQVVFWLLAERSLYYIFVAAIFGGIEVLFYWIPYHISFVRKTSTHDGHFGKSTGKRIFLIKIFSGLAPLIGGLTISIFGFNTLFVMSLILIVVSGLPIFFTVSENKHSSHDVKKIIKKYVLDKKMLNTSISMSGATMENVVYSVFWSVLLYLFLQNFGSLGLLNSVSLIVSSLFVLYIGNFIDKKGPYYIHEIGVIVNALIYIPRMFISGGLILFVLEFADKINGTLFTLPRMSLEYKIGEEGNLSDFVVYREIVIHFSKALICLLFILFIVFFNWKLIFIFGIIGSFFSYFIEFN